MNKKFCLLLLSPMIISLAGCGGNSDGGKPKDRKPVDVVIISGQSNGVGCTWCNQIPECPSLGMDKYDEYLVGYPGIKIAFESWTVDWPATTVSLQNGSRGKFVDVQLGQGNGSHSFGPEIGIAEATHEKYDGQLFLVKFACGASNLKDHWLDKRKSPMYGKFITYVKERMTVLEEMGYAPTIKAFCWMQGEGDSYANYYEYYLDNLRTFVTNVREDLKDYSGDKEFAFIDAGINNNPSRWQYWKEVNDAKIAFSEESENNFYIDTIGAGMHTDQEPRDKVDADHYDSESEVLLGHLFAEAFEPFLMDPENKE